jgi:hypothetical protein
MRADAWAGVGSENLATLFQENMTALLGGIRLVAA